MSFAYSPKWRFFSHGLAIEGALHIDFNKTIFDLKNVYFETIYNHILSFKEHYASHELNIHENLKKTELEKKIHVCVQYVTANLAFCEYYRIQLYDKKRSIIEGYKKAFELSAKKLNCSMLDEVLSKGGGDRFQKKLVDFFDRSVAYLERSLIHECVKIYGKNCIITLDTLRLEHLFDIPDHVKGIVFKNFFSKGKIDLRFCSIYDIPIVQYAVEKKKTSRLLVSSYDNMVMRNPKQRHIIKYERKNLEHRYMNTKDYSVNHYGVNIFAQIGSKKNVEYLANNPMYEGIGMYHTEYDYLTFDMAMSEEFMTERYQVMIDEARKADKEIIFSLADIRKDKGFNMPNNITIDLIDCEKYPGIFVSQIKAIAKAAQGYQKISIAIPMIYQAKEIEEWRFTIEYYFELFDQAIPKVGFIFETESMYEYMYDLFNTKFDFVIIGFNDLFSDLYDINPYENINIKKFKSHYYEELRIIHSLFLDMKVRHICIGNALLDSEVLHKLMKMGFRDFSIPRHIEQKAHHILKTRDKNKDRYVGDYMMQIALRDYRLYLFEQTGVKPPNRKINERKKKRKRIIKRSKKKLT